jgi:hypothetical protein
MALQRSVSPKKSQKTIKGPQAVEWWTRPVRDTRPKAKAADAAVVVPDPPETTPQQPEPPQQEPAVASATQPVETSTEAPAPDTYEVAVIPPTLTVPSTSTRPSSDQRLKIRFALDQHFDDRSGEYLGDQSDQSIADSIGVPAAWVETIREVAYAPLLRSAEAKRRAAEIAIIRELFTDYRRKLLAAMDRLDKLESELS